MSDGPRHVVVCGGGVIGAAIAFFLSKRRIRTTIIERCTPGCAASGKSAGFLAFDWCDGSPQGALARCSFTLHESLARELRTDYGYQRVDTLALVAGSPEYDLSGYGDDRARPTWLDGNCTLTGSLGSTLTTAQIQPLDFTRALVNEARHHGAELQHGTVVGIQREAGRVSGVRMGGEVVDCDAVVLALGPWTNSVGAELGLPSVSGLKGSSLVLRPAVAVPAQAYFVDYIGSNGLRLQPEVVARGNGEVYLCGVPEKGDAPDDPGTVAPSQEARMLLESIAGTLSTTLAEASLEHVQACFRPIVEDAMPLIGAIDSLPGAFVATAHNCWGMLNAPATGLAMSELLCDGEARCVDIRALTPARF